METYKTIKNTSKVFFTTNDLKRILEAKTQRGLESSIKKLLDSEFLTFIEKGKYYLTELSPSKFEIAYFIYSPSYISLESALNYRGILSQFPSEITSISTKKPVLKEFQGQVFSYSKINRGFFFGYEKVGESLIATPEKALFDYMYLISKGLRSESYLNEMDFTCVKKKTIKNYAKLLRNPKPIYNLINKYL